MYPPPHLAPSARDQVSVVDGTVRIEVPFTVAGDAVPQQVELTGDLRYQACTDSVCLFPVDAHPKAVVDVR